MVWTCLLLCFTGDVFILVFSLDNRESFQEVERLKRQIYETKSCLRNKTKENVDVPLVICGNKCDKDFYREVQEEEIEQLVGGDEHCAYFEISAKKNTNVDQMFQTLFTMAKLPNEMSPDRHCKVSLQYCELLHRKSFRNKKCKDGNAYGVVAPFARRPSVHSDLMYIKGKAVGGTQTKERGCVICWHTWCKTPSELFKSWGRDRSCSAHIHILPEATLSRGARGNGGLLVPVDDLTCCKKNRLFISLERHLREKKVYNKLFLLELECLLHYEQIRFWMCIYYVNMSTFS